MAGVNVFIIFNFSLMKNDANRKYRSVFFFSDVFYLSVREVPPDPESISASADDKKMRVGISHGILRYFFDTFVGAFKTAED